MSSITIEIFPCSSLKELDLEQWSRSSFHLAVEGGARPWLCRDFAKPLLVLVPDMRQARDFKADSETLRIDPHVEILPELPLSTETVNKEGLWVRRGAVLEMWRKRGGLLVATPGALMEPFSLGGRLLSLSVGQEMARETLVRWLADHGYERVDLVWSPGQFVVRGGIIDCFDPSSRLPIRIEFLDDRIESLRLFAPEDQRSVVKMDQFALHGIVSSSKAPALSELLPQEVCVLLFEPKEVEQQAENVQWLWEALRQEISLPPLLEWTRVEQLLSGYPKMRLTKEAQRAYRRFPLRDLPHFRGKWNEVEHACETWIAEGYRVIVCSTVEHTLQWGRERGWECRFSALSGGFLDPVSKCVFVSDFELVGLSAARRSEGGGVPREWGERLVPGQWVVHEEYGIARFCGSERIKSQEGEQEYLALEFAEQRRLLVPVMHFYKISPYFPPFGQEPVPDSLKGSAWKKASQKAREKAERVAKDLIEIYAHREIMRGFAFPKNEEMMDRFAATFPFIETTDQLKAIQEVESDMEKPAPMDRLLVGDVGFGKTEVAMRAVFKAVLAGKQAAVLAPTTILAQQHFENFFERFSPFAVRVEVLSRFVSPGRQKQILEDVAQGKVDVLIGTHRILSEDVVFKDLGLVVVDEEHRFGVLHKEHLKKKHPQVDVLMLSATPIPRTLYFSLSGLRDMSLLNTPPHHRLPVITFVGPWKEEVVRGAILREKSRGGQVFFVHNRVQSIQQKALLLRRLFPRLKVFVAHGQMPESELERTMLAFSSGECDILVCTTIIESGLDIPRANTLIVDDAHELGLAQMYQLRGRVGRREEQAFAYFFYPPEASLSKESRERLEAIGELDELGAGYQLAERDLQIRGGGDLIGTSQHGNMSRVGFSLYCRMLEEEIQKVRGKWHPSTEIDVQIPSAIPSSYLPQESLRIALYRRLLRLDSDEEILALRGEVEDRFGPLPRAVEFLFAVARMRVLGPQKGIRKVVCGKDGTLVQGDPEQLMEMHSLPKGWVRRLDGFIGPGGYEGLVSLLSEMGVS